MKIAINTIPLLSPLTGVGNYTYHVAKHLHPLDPESDFTYFYGFYSKKLSLNENGGGLLDKRFEGIFRAKKLLSRVPLCREAAKKALGAINKLSLKRFDLYFEPNFIPLDIKAGRTVVTVHDFAFLKRPEWLPRDRAAYMKKNFRAKIGRADRVIVVSEFTKKEALDLLDIPEEKVRVVHNGFDSTTFRPYSPDELGPLREKYGLPERFILFVGALEPRKNIESLIRAYLKLDERVRKGCKLIIAGPGGWKNKVLMELIREQKEDIRWVGYMAGTELGELYNLAEAFIYPSFYEGFGIPLLEAMACGCPVVTSGAASMPEVCGDAACYVDPHDVEDISRGIHEVMSDDALRETMTRKGLERAGLFSWERSAREHLELFKECLGE